MKKKAAARKATTKAAPKVARSAARLTAMPAKPARPANGIEWFPTVVRMGYQCFVGVVPVRMLQFIDGNPIARQDPSLGRYNTGRFQKSVKETGGFIEPVTVGGLRTDMAFKLANGNRRTAGDLAAFGPEHRVPLTLVEGADPYRVFAILNGWGAGQAIAPCDKPLMFLEHPEMLADSEEVKQNLASMRKVVGEELFVEFCRSGKSYDLYRRASSLARYCGLDERSYGTFTRWMLRHCKSANHVEQQAVRMKLFAPEEVVRAVMGNHALPDRVAELKKLAQTATAPAPTTNITVNN